MATLAFENVKKGDGRAIRRAAETTYNTFKGYLAPHSVFKQYMQMAGDPTTKALGKMTPEEKETKLDQAIAFLKSVPGFEAHARRLEAMNLGYLRGVSNPFANKFTTIIKDILPIKDKLSFPDSADPRMTPRIRSKFIEFAETGERIRSKFARRLKNAR